MKWKETHWKAVFLGVGVVLIILNILMCVNIISMMGQLEAFSVSASVLPQASAAQLPPSPEPSPSPDAEPSPSSTQAVQSTKPKPAAQNAGAEQPPVAAKPAPEPSAAEPPAQKQDVTVYVTKTGNKYHRDGCYHLKSRIPMSLSEACQRFGPCSDCNPPIPED